MRLGQLARKLDISTSEIVKFSASELGVEVLHHPNTKVPDEVVARIEKHFEIKVDDAEEKVDLVEQPTEDRIAPEIEEERIENLEIIESKEEEIHDAVEPLVAMSEDNEAIPLRLEDGVIKAPKIELPKPKVVGKIELPEPKIEEKQEEVVAESENIDEDLTLSAVEHNETAVKENDAITEKPRTERNKKRKSNRNSRGEKRKAEVLTYEEEIRRKKEAYEKQRAEEIAAEKERKKRNYEQLMQKKKQEAGEPKRTKKQQIANKTKELKEKPTTLWGKFLYWLNN
ncbi:MAG: hypothetical protein JJT77_04080 [Crocinitomicaceae bacterium]|nr:hypothetical protein [Crocinitomicaceae bacterium]